MSPQRRRSAALRQKRSKRNTRGWIGRDVVHARLRGARRLMVPVLVATGLGLLGLAVLRVDVIRQRYALQAALEELRALESEERVLAAQRRRQRKPLELEERARALGFGPPERIIELPQGPSALPAPATAEEPPQLAARAGGTP